MVVLGQKWFYSGKNGCIRAEQLCSDKSVCTRAKWSDSGKSGFIAEKVVVFVENALYSGKVVSFGQKWFYCEKWL